MSETKTVQRRIRPITIQCGVPRCSTPSQDAVLNERDDGTWDVIAPKGWAFSANPQGTGEVFVGTCPLHSAT